MKSLLIEKWGLADIVCNQYLEGIKRVTMPADPEDKPAMLAYVKNAYIKLVTLTKLKVDRGQLVPGLENYYLSNQFEDMSVNMFSMNMCALPCNNSPTRHTIQPPYQSRQRAEPRQAGVSTDHEGGLRNWKKSLQSSECSHVIKKTGPLSWKAVQQNQKSVARQRKQHARQALFPQRSMRPQPQLQSPRRMLVAMQGAAVLEWRMPLTKIRLKCHSMSSQRGGRSQERTEAGVLAPE
jgi:hypothetical protein